MSKILELFKLMFLSTPKNAWELAKRNESRIGFLTVIMMCIIVYLALIGYFPTWSFIK